ncbi:MAG: hypothetical protein P4L33_14030 [Capsulimonadaceae bacterium]|nr:hypothetical protein [Capsulimonadaceae bacterium]
MNLRFFAFGLIAAIAATIVITTSSIAAPSTTASATSSTSSTSSTSAPAATNKYHGVVTAVDVTASTITINNKKLGTFTFTVSATTKITVNKTAGALGEIQVGQVASIVSNDGKAADKIAAKDKVNK